MKRNRNTPNRLTGAGAHLAGLRTSNAAGRHARGTNRQRTRADRRRAAINDASR